MRLWSQSRHPPRATRILRPEREDGRQKSEDTTLIGFNPSPYFCLRGLLRYSLFDGGSYFRIVGLNLRLEAGDDRTVLADQKLGEVPLNVAAGGLGQVVVEGCDI
jgi:hypothetical protein